jgi:chromate transport protein ChrA
MGVATTVAVAVRLVYLRRIFPGLPLARHVARGLGPTLPATAAVLALRAAGPADRDPAWVALEAAVFVALAVAATLVSERALLRESLGYLRRGAPLAAASA